MANQRSRAALFPPVSWIALAAIVSVAGLTAWGVPLMAGGQPAADSPSLQGKTVLITGSTDGLGREVARRVASLGAHVIVHGRNQERGDALVAEIAGEGNGSAKNYPADFASLAEVRKMGDAILRDYPRLDVLVNNAGIWLRGDRRVSQDGYELHFAVNYLSGFLLTRMLLPRLVESAPSRIVNVASSAQSAIDFDDVMLERPGRAQEGYGQSKLAQILFAMDLADELRGQGVTVAALHPATLMDTAMVREAGVSARTTIDEGANAVMHLITGRDVESGQYFNGLRPARANAQAYDAAARARLRELSLELTGLNSR
jgi:NAD(P)-dependent dehydrogenase (short-subunit alcohol dehydrogenase family)